MGNNISCETAKCLIFAKGNKVKNLRMLNKLTIEELSGLANVSEEFLKSIECKKTELIDSNLTKIANVLNIDAELLLDSSMCLDNQDWYFLNNVLQPHKDEFNFSQFQIQILNLISIILYKNRKKWEEMRKDSIAMLCKTARKDCALNARKLRDEKYAPFRTYYKQIQYERFVSYYKVGKILSANSFATWYLANESEKIHIPYVKQNAFNKLVQLAQQNNREFKKLLRVEADTSIVVAD